jgi:hypothetical protein
MPDDRNPASPESADSLAERQRQLAERERVERERHRDRMEVERHDRESTRIAGEAARVVGETERAAAEVNRQEAMGEVRVATDLIRETLERMEAVEALRRAAVKGDRASLKPGQKN